MTEVLVLDPPEAAKVRGRSPKDEGHALDPVPLKDGRFYLGAEVLEDPAHEDVRDFLRSMPLVPLEKLPLFTEEDEAPVREEVLVERKAVFVKATAVEEIASVKGAAR